MWTAARTGSTWTSWTWHFVPNPTFGAPVVKSLSKRTDAFLDCHLMVTNPPDYVQPLRDAGANMFTFHVEASFSALDAVRRCATTPTGMLAGVALKPGTPAEAVHTRCATRGRPRDGPRHDRRARVRWAGFMPETMPKVRALRARYPELDVQVDGGLGPNTIDQAADAGANVIVAGSSVFGAPDPVKAIATLRAAVENRNAERRDRDAEAA